MRVSGHRRRRGVRERGRVNVCVCLGEAFSFFLMFFSLFPKFTKFKEFQKLSFKSLKRKLPTTSGGVFFFL